MWSMFAASLHVARYMTFSPSTLVAASCSGNGCTSGHGICGNARLSRRSMTATVVFMIMGVLVATAFETNRALDIDGSPATARIVWPTRDQLLSAGIAVVLSIVLLVGTHRSVAHAVRRLSSSRTMLIVCELFSEVLVGFIFGVGLTVSGMMDPAKVSGFLTARKSWDPSLAFVMGGALAVTVPGYRWMTRTAEGLSPACGMKFNAPGQGIVDVKLLVGAAVFGAGWGLAGSCPGPVLVFIGGHPEWVSPWAWFAAFVTGQWIHCGAIGRQVHRWYFGDPDKEARQLLIEEGRTASRA